MSPTPLIVSGEEGGKEGGREGGAKKEGVAHLDYPLTFLLLPPSPPQNHRTTALRWCARGRACRPSVSYPLTTPPSLPPSLSPSLPRSITEQLRYGGVLEAVRVARSGYPVRLIHPEFYARYRCLAASLPPSLPPSSSVPLPHVIDDVRDPAKAREWCLRVLDAILEGQVGREGGRGGGEGGWVGVIDDVMDLAKARERCLGVLDAILEGQVGREGGREGGRVPCQ